MKKYLTLVLALATGLSFAQPYNNTYDVNLNFDQLRPGFNIVNNTQDSWTVSDGTNGQSNYFILTKLAVNGNPVCNTIVRANNDPMEGFLYVEALCQTADEGVIVGGYWYADRNNMVLQPFLAKFDKGCNMRWIRIYPVNQRLIVNAANNKVSLCRVVDLPSVEYYYFVVAGDSDINPGVEVATHVLQVDGSNAGAGNLIFSNKYYPVVITPGANLRDYPSDIEYSTTQQMYMITGQRQTGPGSAVAYEMYHFGIINNGNMFLAANNYLSQISNSRPVDQDMVYDAINDQFATVFTHDVNGYVPAIPSIIGFVKVTPALVPANFGLIWHNQGVRHNGRSISNRLPGNGFALTAGVIDVNNGLNNPALQLVNNVGVPAGNFMRYNVLDNVFFAHHAWNPVRDEFVLASEQNTDLRVISTSPVGAACGMRQYQPVYQSYNPSLKYYDYQPRRFDKQMQYSTPQSLPLPPFRMCVPPGNSYRTTGLSSYTTDKLDIKVYPSVVSKNNAELTIENGSGVEMRVEVRNITGQLIQATDNVGSGKTTVTLSQGLSAGVYMVHFYNADGNISATEKILISE